MRTAIVFDVGSTLIHPDFEALRNWIGERSPVSVNVAGIERAFRRAIAGSVFSAAKGAEEQAEQFFRLAGCRAETSDQWPLWWSEIVRAGGADSWLYTCLDNEAKSTLQTLRERDLRLIAASNSDGTLKQELIQFGLLHFFEMTFDSHDLHIEKPDAAFYQHVLDAVASPQCLHVGDDLIKDLLGPLAAGFNAALLYDPADIYLGAPPRMKIRRLGEIADTVERLL